MFFFHLVGIHNCMCVCGGHLTIIITQIQLIFICIIYQSMGWAKLSRTGREGDNNFFANYKWRSIDFSFFFFCCACLSSEEADDIENERVERDHMENIFHSHTSICQFTHKIITKKRTRQVFCNTTIDVCNIQSLCVWIWFSSIFF